MIKILWITFIVVVVALHYVFSHSQVVLYTGNILDFVAWFIIIMAMLCFLFSKTIVNDLVEKGNARPVRLHLVLMDATIIIVFAAMGDFFWAGAWCWCSCIMHSIRSISHSKQQQGKE